MRLTLTSGDDRGRSFDLEDPGEYTIGRDVHCSIHIRDLKSSRRHARVLIEKDGSYLEDLDSTNGTRLNGQPGLRFVLADGDVIGIGDTCLQVSGLGGAARRTGAIIGDGRMFKTQVLAALPQKDADYVDGRPAAAVLEDVLLENRHLRKLMEIGQILAGKGEPGEILRAILRTMLPVLDADTGCVLTNMDDSEEWVIREIVSTAGDPREAMISRTILQQAVTEGVALLTTNPRDDRRFDPSKSILMMGVSSALCAPVRIDNRLQGILFFDRRHRDEVFTDIDLRLAATVANILGLLLEKEQVEAVSRQRERMAVIGEVIAELAHHIKNTIATLRFAIENLQLVLRNVPNRDAARALQVIGMQERRISDLVLNMLTFSKERVPVRVRVELGPFLADVVEPYRAYMESIGIRLDLAVEPSTPVLFADDAGLQRILVNLLVNSIEAIESDRTPGKPREIRIAAQAGPGPDEVMLRFRDTGTGIAPDVLKNLMTLLYSTKGGRGTGFGLAVAKKVIEEHGGHIRGDSVEGQWTEFTLVLPVGVPSAITA